MMTVNKTAKISGVSVRTLHYYDEIGLLRPVTVTPAGYRLYDESSLMRLQQILLFRELAFSLKDIKEILDSPHFDKEDALIRQIELLKQKKAQTEALIFHAEQLLHSGGNVMSFQVFNNEAYVKKAKERWGNTDAYKEYEAKNAEITAIQSDAKAQGLMRIFAEIGTLRLRAPEEPVVQEKIKCLQNYITQEYYTCTNPLLAGLGNMYIADEEMKGNIDMAGGEGTAEFVAKAIAVYTGL